MEQIWFVQAKRR